MTDVIASPAGALFALDLWHSADPAAVAAAISLALPAPGQAVEDERGTVLRLSRQRWWLLGDGFADLAHDSALTDHGVISAVGGGWTRVQMTRPDWRALLMTSGLIDAEHPDFGPGSTAISLLCHVRCVIHVRAAQACDIFVPASYTDHCLAQWRGQ